MRLSERDNDQLGMILHYCQRLQVAHERFGRDFQTFKSDIPYQDSSSFCLIQVGEAVNRLSDDFVATHPQVDWRRIYGVRCHLMHGYDRFDAEIVWDAIESHIPALESFCQEHFEG